MFISKKEQKRLSRLIEEQTEIKGRSLWKDAFRVFCKNHAAMFSVLLLILIVLFTLIVPFIVPHGYAETNWQYILSPPSLKAGYLMGSDALGRDLLVRTAIGGRISLMVGILGAVMAVVVGTVYGAVSGYFGGWLDSLMMRVVDMLNAFPFMFFVILLVTVFGRQIYFIFIAIGLFSWIDVARIVRGQVLSLKAKEYVESAKINGLGSFAIIRRHMLPNVIGIVLIYTSILVPSMILLESFLSFLGLGIQEPLTSWGALLQEGAQNMQVALWQLVFPGIFLVTTLFCFNFIGDGLRDAFDPKER